MKYPVPAWFDQIRCNFLAGNCHQFLLDGNIDDSFFRPDEFAAESLPAGEILSLRRLLIGSLLKPFRQVLTYSPTSGIRIFGTASEGGRALLFPRSDGFPAPLAGDGAEIENYKGLPDVMADVERRHIPLTSNGIDDKVLAAFLQIEGILSRRWVDEQKQPYRLAVIIDHFDKILTTTTERVVRHLTEQVQRWASDPRIAQTANLSLLLAENRDNLPSVFHSDEGGTLPVRVPFPDRAYRSLFFEQHSSAPTPLGEFLATETGSSQAVQLTQGFKLADCVRIERIASRSAEDDSGTGILREHFFGKSGPLSGKDLSGLLMREKRDVISSNSRGMLEPLESSIRFDDIGGLEGVKDYFRRVAGAIRNRNGNPGLAETTPKGVLLAGPPGTGKTLIAKALAREAGISLVKMGEIRSMWVGESERNMSLVLNLLREMEPVVVFIDEIDQAIGSRSTSSGDSGVSGRIFGKILEFMGDNDNRGKVIWVAATNRADLLDEAMKRRFDRIIPVLLPGSGEEWGSVIDGISRQIGTDMGKKVIAGFVDGNLDMIRRNHSGSSMEMVLRLAYQLALEDGVAPGGEHLSKAFEGVKSNFNQQVYREQTLLALEACNEIGFIPRPEKGGYSYGYGENFDKSVLRALEERSNQPLEEERRLLYGNNRD